MLKSIGALAVLSASAAFSVAVECSELVPLQSSRSANLEAPKIAARQQAIGKGGELIGQASRLVENLLFEASFSKQSESLVEEARAKVENGASTAVIVAEIYSNQVGYREIGPMTVASGDSVMDALKNFHRSMPRSSLRRDRGAMSRSYILRVLSKANLDAGLTNESFPDELMRIASEQSSLEAGIRDSRDQARNAVRAEATAKAREARQQSSREPEGGRGNSGMAGAGGGQRSDPKGGVENRGGEAKDPGRGEASDSGDAGDSNGPEIRGKPI